LDWIGGGGVGGGGGGGGDGGDGAGDAWELEAEGFDWEGFVAGQPEKVRAWCEEVRCSLTPPPTPPPPPSPSPGALYLDVRGVAGTYLFYHPYQARSTLMFEGLLDLMRGGRTSLEGDAEGDIIDETPTVLLEVLLDAGGGGGGGSGGGSGGGGSGGGPSVSVRVREGGDEAEARALLPSRPAPSDTARSEKSVAAALAGLGEAEWAAATRRMRAALVAVPAQAAELLQEAGGGLQQVEQALRAAAERAEAGGGARHGRAAMALRLQLAGYAGAGAHGATGALREWDAAWAAAPEQAAERRVVEAAARARLRRMSGDEVVRARAELLSGGRVFELCVEREAEEARQRATATAARWRSRAAEGAAAAVEAAAAARTVPREGQPCNCVPPLPPAEGEEEAHGADCGAEGAEASEGALEVSVALARCAVALVRAHADADGKTCRRQLIEMRASAGFVELARRAARLRTADAARLGDGARLAFWLNVYNALVLHGCALHAHELPHGCLRLVRLHARFCYEVGGSLISAIEIEHAVLRKLLPRPAFPGASWLIPKFGAADPRAALAPPPCTLLCFGLAPGTAFAPPLRAYGLGLRERRNTAKDRTAAESAAAAASGVELQRVSPEASGWQRVVTELEANAREHLAATATLQLDASRQGGLSGELRLPVQLYWHQVRRGAGASKRASPCSPPAPGRPRRPVASPLPHPLAKPTRPKPTSPSPTPYRPTWGRTSVVRWAC